jgi:hypothetical protein
MRLMPISAVRREKALVHRGWKSLPGAGSFRPVTIEAVVEVTKPLKPSVKKGRNGDPVSVQAVIRVNAEQASKWQTQEPTRLSIGEGRCRWNGVSGQVSSVLPG